MILAAIMLKMGGYGFLRFNMPITPDASHELAWLMITLSLIAIVYIALVALVQGDMKKLIAYSRSPIWVLSPSACSYSTARVWKGR